MCACNCDCSMDCIDRGVHTRLSCGKPSGLTMFSMGLSKSPWCYPQRLVDSLLVVENWTWIIGTTMAMDTGRPSQKNGYGQTQLKRICLRLYRFADAMDWCDFFTACANGKVVRNTWIAPLPVVIHCWDCTIRYMIRLTWKHRWWLRLSTAG